MGLLYPFPANEQEIDRIGRNADSITLKSYGLPLIFWGYYGAVLCVLIAMILAVKDPLLKLYALGDRPSQLLAISVWVILTAIAVVGLAMLFYEKWLTREQDQLKITHRLFFIPVWQKTIRLHSKQPFGVKHFMDSPNMAKIQGKTELRAFENQGHYLLYAYTQTQQAILIDRHSRQGDLKNMARLLSL